MDILNTAEELKVLKESDSQKEARFPTNIEGWAEPRFVKKADDYWISLISDVPGQTVDNGYGRLILDTGVSISVLFIDEKKAEEFYSKIPKSAKVSMDRDTPNRFNPGVGKDGYWYVRQFNNLMPNKARGSLNDAGIKRVKKFMSIIEKEFDYKFPEPEFWFEENK